MQLWRHREPSYTRVTLPPANQARNDQPALVFQARRFSQYMLGIVEDIFEAFIPKTGLGVGKSVKPAVDLGIGTSTRHVQQFHRGEAADVQGLLHGRTASISVHVQVKGTVVCEKFRHRTVEMSRCIVRGCDK